MPSPLLAYIDALPAYDTCEGQIKRMDLLRDIQQAGDSYYYKGYPVPSQDPSILGNGASLDPLQTYDFALTIPVGSIVTMISQYTTQPEGISLQIKEVSSESNLFLNLSPRSSMFGNFITQPFLTDPQTTDVPIGPTMAWPYFIVLQDEKLNVTIKNLSKNVQYAQVYIECAIPISASTMGREAVTSGNRG